MNAKAAQVLATLKTLQASQEICIIRISEPITSASSQDARQRVSDVSTASLDGPRPASLEADLSHYTELFAKLRFSYVEQVTKEKFIRAIVGDPPLIVTMQENLDLEKENQEAKAQLKALKMDVAEMVVELEARGRELSRRYETIQLETTRLQDLPQETAALQSRVEELKAASAQEDFARADNTTSDPAHLRLPLRKTRELVTRKRKEQLDLERELEALQAKVPRKQREAERLLAELQPLEAKRANSMAAAKEAQRRKDAESLGSTADDLEQRARWWRASESILTSLAETPS